MHNHSHQSCDDFREQLDALVDRELSGMECQAVREHCVTCDSCREEVAVLETLTNRFRAACADPVPASLCDEILEKVNRAERA